MPMPRESECQKLLNTEGCIELYFHGHDTGYRLKRSELEHALDAKTRKLVDQEFRGLLGSTVHVDGADIRIIFDMPPEVCARMWEEDLADARHDMGMTTSE